MSSISIATITASCLLSRVNGSHQEHSCTNRVNPIGQCISIKRRLMFGFGKRKKKSEDPELPGWGQWHFPVEFYFREEPRPEYVHDVKELNSFYHYLKRMRLFVNCPNLKVWMTGDDQPSCSTKIKEIKHEGKSIQVFFKNNKSKKYEEGEHIPICIRHGTVLCQSMEIRIKNGKPQYYFNPETSHSELIYIVQLESGKTDLTIKTGTKVKTFYIDEKHMPKFSDCPKENMKELYKRCWKQDPDSWKPHVPEVLTLYSTRTRKDKSIHVDDFVLHLKDPKVQRFLSQMMGFKTIEDFDDELTRRFKAES